MNATFLKVLTKVRLGLFITELNIKGKIRRRRPKTLKRILSRSGFTLFRCYSAIYERERERERERSLENERKERTYA